MSRLCCTIQFRYAPTAVGHGVVHQVKPTDFLKVRFGSGMERLKRGNSENVYQVVIGATPIVARVIVPGR